MTKWLKIKNIIVEKFNEYFCNIGPNLKKNIPNSQTDFHDYLVEPNMQSLFLVPKMKKNCLVLLEPSRTRKVLGMIILGTNLLSKLLSVSFNH